MIEEKGDYTALICDDCREEIFVDVNMYMVKDKLPSNGYFLCLSIG